VAASKPETKRPRVSKRDPIEKLPFLWI
jgi:hypothetical protein